MAARCSGSLRLDGDVAGHADREAPVVIETAPVVTTTVSVPVGPIVRDHRGSISVTPVRPDRTPDRPIVRDHRGPAAAPIRDHRSSSPPPAEKSKVRDHR